jgi:Na+-transporting methylmalonyl-CoA/oxaloacetate decarboxylase gamma subunit
MLQGIGGGIILAIVNFLMVFLVLGGLAGVLVGLKRLVQFWEGRQNQQAAPSEQIAGTGKASPETPLTQSDKKLMAAITAALHEFTSLPVGALQIDTIEPLGEVPVPNNQLLAVITAALHQYLETPEGAFTIRAVEPIGLRTGLSTVDPRFVAISAALHEYLATPEGSFRIVRIQSAGAVNTWKMAGRLDLMDFDNN